MKAFQKMGISAERVLARIGKASVSDLTTEDVADLVGIGTAIRDGDTTIEEAFQVAKGEGAAKAKTPPEANGERTSNLADKVKGKAKATATQVKTIKDLAGKVMSREALEMFLKEEYGAAKPEDLQGEQAEAFIARLKQSEEGA
jgi:hypothetical protein